MRLLAEASIQTMRKQHGLRWIIVFATGIFIALILPLALTSSLYCTWMKEHTDDGPKLVDTIVAHCSNVALALAIVLWISCQISSGSPTQIKLWIVCFLCLPILLKFTCGMWPWAII